MQSERNLEIRKMEPGEKKEVQRLGQKSFTGMERFFISKPEDAIVITDRDKIVAAGVMKIIDAGGIKTGDFDMAYVDPACHGKGLGSKLYAAVTEYLKEKGCSFITAEVKDDNPGSWHLLEKNGYRRIRLFEAVKHLGADGFYAQLVKTPILFGYGMDYYMASINNADRLKEKKNGGLQFLSHLAVNLLIFCLSLIFNTENRTPWLFIAYALVLAVPCVLSGFYLLMSRSGWKFRMTNCGGFMSAIVALMGGVLPMIGNWYPDKYEKTAVFNRRMGVTAWIEWLSLLAAFAVSSCFTSVHLLMEGIYYICYVVLVYRLIPIYPFESFGGRRVWLWNKAIFLITAAATIAALWYLG